MVPANLSVIEGGIHSQTRLALRHVSRVIEAIAPSCSVKDVCSCVCYITHPDYIPIAREEWNKSRQDNVRHMSRDM